MESKYFYCKLAIKNIQKNHKAYFPYILAVIVDIAMFYIVYSLSQNKSMDTMLGINTIRDILSFGTILIALFSLIFLFYINSFLMKNRNKELSLFIILGMEKKHVLRIIFLETLFIAFIGIIFGIIGGIVLDKLLYLCIGRMFKSKVILGFYISFPAIISTIILFNFIFLLIYLKSRKRIKLSNPIELLKSSNTGEKEPKTKLIQTILGIVCLSIGYYISISTKNPLTAFGLFFIAVILVIIGTYLLFSAGSIALLKGLKKNKNYFYKSNHFISVSSMIYRMKQNAVGLANICILCTMVLIMLSSTISMWVGIEDMILERYPKEIVITLREPTNQNIQQIYNISHQIVNNRQMNVEEETQYTYLAFSALNSDGNYSTEQYPMASLDKIETLFFITLNDYYQLTQENTTLDEDEILLYTNKSQYNQDTLSIFDKNFKVKEKVDDFIKNGAMVANITTTQFIVVKDEKILNELYLDQKEAYKDNASTIQYFYGFEVNFEKEEIYNQILNELKDLQINFSIESRTVERNAFMGLYAGLLFLGVFLSTLFIMATILIIYYKQISEGYEDKERFEIMQKVGMDQKLVKKSIRSQILTVFLLPPIVAGIHDAVAFPFISKILNVFGLMNIKLYTISSIACFLIFLLAYVGIYSLTAKTYYHIVKR